MFKVRIKAKGNNIIIAEHIIVNKNSFMFDVFKEVYKPNKYIIEITEVKENEN